MARTDNKLLALIGCNCTGDLGPYTFYRSRRGQLVFFPRAPALQPASPTQRIMRNRWRAIAIRWRTLTTPERADWLAAAKICRLRMTGYNLWVYWLSKHDEALIAAVERYTGTPLNRGN